MDGKIELTKDERAMLKRVGDPRNHFANVEDIEVENTLKWERDLVHEVGRSLSGKGLIHAFADTFGTARYSMTERGRAAI